MARLHAPDFAGPPDAADKGEVTLAALQLRTVSTQRSALADLRTRHVIGDEAFRVIEEELDLLELTAESQARPSVLTSA